MQILATKFIYIIAIYIYMYIFKYLLVLNTREFNSVHWLACLFQLAVNPCTFLEVKFHKSLASRGLTCA